MTFAFVVVARPDEMSFTCRMQRIEPAARLFPTIPVRVHRTESMRRNGLEHGPIGSTGCIGRACTLYAILVRPIYINCCGKKRILYA